MGVMFIQSGRFAAAGFSPLDLSPILWVDPSDSGSVTLNGSNVSQINDKSGNSNHLTQGTPANQPAYNSAPINSLASITVASTGSTQLTSPSFTWPSPVTLFIVARSSDTQYIIVSSDTGSWAAYVARSGNASSPSLGWTVNAARVDAASPAWTTRGEVYTAMNGLHQLSLDLSGTRTGPFLLNGWGATFNGDADVGEIIVCSTPGTTDRDACEAYLKAKWGTP